MRIGQNPRAHGAAVTGLTRPERLAEGAAKGRPAAAIRPKPTLSTGTRKAMLCRPAGAARQTVRARCERDDEGQWPWPERLGKVLGLGWRIKPCSSAASRLATCAMRGLNVGLAFAA